MCGLGPRPLRRQFREKEIPCADDTADVFDETVEEAVELGPPMVEGTRIMVESSLLGHRPIGRCGRSMQYAFHGRVEIPPGGG